MTSRDFLKYRSVWLGIAMIGIVWFHSEYEFSLPFINELKPFAYGGVDICFFASGIGCYFSLSKDPDPYRFLKRRFSRIFPMYLCFMALWIPFMALTDEMGIGVALGNLFAVQTFTGSGGDFNWYICATLLFYIFAPYLKSAVDQAKGAVGPMLILTALLLISVPFWGSAAYIIFMTRLPVFFVGILFGKRCFGGKPFSVRSMAVYICIAAFGALALDACMDYCYRTSPAYLWDYGLYWYPFLLITPGLCIAISLVMGLLERWKVGRWLVLVLTKIGDYSYEICLMHILVFDVLEYMHLYNYRPKVFYFSIPCMAVGCVALRYAVRMLQKWTKGLQRV